MLNFSCPVCAQTLKLQDGVYRCENNHCFDVARAGYVNLLQSQKSSNKRHGDDKLMVDARSAFLDAGYYKCLANALLETIKKHAPNAQNIVDAGCGECWYTAQVAREFEKASVAAVDISKNALIAGAKRKSGISLAVASIAKLPFANESCDLLISLFAPTAADEYSRILTDSGVLIRAVPLQRHLYGLKSAIYDKPYENPPEDGQVVGFKLVDRVCIFDEICLTDNAMIQNLFKMTPYYYKTSKKDQQKLQNLSELKTEIAFALLVYKKR